MAPKWSDEMNLKFVELYKEQRCLWDQRDVLYKDRNARETALAAIAENINVQGFGVAEVKAKTKSFRGTFNIEMGKLKKSVKSGCGSADVYVPTLKWFNVMKEVMVNGTLTRQTKGTLIPGACSVPKSTDGDEDHPEQPSADSNLEDGDEQVDDPGNSTSIPEESQNISRPNSSSDSHQQTTPDYQPKKKFKPRSKIQQIASTARELKHLSESVLRSETVMDNEWDLYGKSVAAQLKCLSPAQALTAQMEINNVLTKCRFNDLYGIPTEPDQVLTVSMCHPSNSSSSSNVFMTSPEPEEEMSQNVIISTTATTGTSVAKTFSQVFNTLSYNHDG